LSNCSTKVSAVPEPFWAVLTTGQVVVFWLTWLVPG
jgi:hypothetical protein